MRKTIAFRALFGAVLFLQSFTVSPEEMTDNGLPLYKNSDLPVEKRVDDLLSRMTLEDKVGQMNIPCAYKKRIGWGLGIPEESMHYKLDVETREKQLEGARKFAAGTWDDRIGPGGGLFTFPDRIIYEGTKRQVDILNELQEIAVEQTPLGIPLLQIEEGTHGLMCSGATIFPEGLGIGSSWNMDLVENIYAACAREGRAIGVHGLCTLVIEPNRDPRLGRNEEGYSECPFLCSRIAESIVRGTQGYDVSQPDKLVAFLSHYPGQSEPVSGMEFGQMHVSERKLREIFLPPWEAAITECGALGIMATYPAIDGVTVHSSPWILTTLLRGDLGFRGVTLSEGRGISTIIQERIVDNEKDAGRIAVQSGVDVGISTEDAYLVPLIENVREGRVSMATIDRAVGRILDLKFRLGLFENPYADPERAVETVHCDDHRRLALRASREGIVLLKNDGDLLPLDKKVKRIAVIGPNADAGRDQLGDYSPYNIITDIVTVLDGIKSKVSSKTTVEYVEGCHIMGEELNEIDKAVSAAKKADVAIVVVGESEKTDGEGRDVATLELTGMQQDLVEAVHATGTPVIVVLINGRPLAIPWIAEHVSAIVEAWNCGEEGGNAVADVLFGDYNPSGRLPVTVPRHAGQLPVYYNYTARKAGTIKRGYIDLSGEPLYEFGYGLSYTSFEYSNLRITPDSIATAGTVLVEVDVENVGDRAGEEVVQLYINDVLSSVSTAVKELRGFEKIALEPGEKKTVTFTILPEHLSLLDRNLKRVVEPGEFEVMVGHSSKDIRLTGTFMVYD